MATVRFTHGLRQDIVTNAKRIYDLKTKAIYERPLPPEWTGDTIYNTLFAPWLTHINALPREFFRTSDKIFVRCRGIGASARTLSLSDQRPFPARRMETQLFERDAFTENAVMLTPTQPSPFQTLFDDLRARSAELATIDEQKTKFVHGVEAVITAHVTLAPALKMWPALWDLIPDRIKDRHREVATRGKAASAAPEVDTAALTAAVVMHKMGV